MPAPAFLSILMLPLITPLNSPSPAPTSCRRGLRVTDDGPGETGPLRVSIWPATVFSIMPPYTSVSAVVSMRIVRLHAPPAAPVNWSLPVVFQPFCPNWIVLPVPIGEAVPLSAMLAMLMTPCET